MSRGQTMAGDQGLASIYKNKDHANRCGLVYFNESAINIIASESICIDVQSDCILITRPTLDSKKTSKISGRYVSFSHDDMDKLIGRYEVSILDEDTIIMNKV